MTAFAVMALVAGTWLSYGSAPARAVVGQTALAYNPRVALLESGAVGPGVCTGVLISSTEIMTSGHCIDQGMTSGTIGSTNGLAIGADDFTVTGARKWTTAPELGVVSITPAVTDISPAAVDTTPGSPALGVPLQIFGYGYSGTPGCGPNLCPSDSKLRQWNAQVEPPASCLHALTDQEACMTPVADTIANGCLGDSGAPVFNITTGRVIGVYYGELGTSAACSAHQPGKFTTTGGAQQFLFG